VRATLTTARTRQRMTSVPVAPKMIEATWSLRVEAAIPRRAGGWGCLEGSKRVHPAPHFRGIHNLQRVELTTARSACHSRKRSSGRSA
jgi:hypothetical protein